MMSNDKLSRTDVESPNAYFRFGMRRRPGIIDGSSSRVDSTSQSSSGRNKGTVRNAISDWMHWDREASILRFGPWRRRVFLIITEPDTSVSSALFYAILISAIFVVNIIMVMQTMEHWQYTPTDCVFCGGNVTYFFDDEDVNARTTKAGIQCTCPPEPREFLMKTLDFLMYFFLVEWCARVLTYVAEDPAKDHIHQFFQWLSYLTSSATIMDALAIFPYFFETLPNTFVSLRLLRLFRIFQLLRLGQHNTIFSTLTNMLQKSLNYLRLLVLILAFGGAFFGSIVYWVERGTWGYHEASGKYLFLRLGVDGVTEEPSPFRSIPDAFWWFMVTATTVGYGDYYPTSPIGKWVACFAMLMGVLVIASPVSVFSDLWSDELKEVKGFEYFRVGRNEEAILPSISPDALVTDESALCQQPQLSGRSHEYCGDSSVIMKKEDLKAMVDCISSIQENQRQLHSILHKYGIMEENDRPKS